MKSKRLPSPPYNPGVRDLVERKRACSPPLAKDEIERGFLGWHENGYLPHRDERGLIQLISDFVGLPAFGKEEKIGLDAGVGSENAVGQADAPGSPSASPIRLG